MQAYETVFITNPELSAEELSGIIQKLKDSISKHSGELVHELVWGRRRLAYQIAKQNFGIYHLWYLSGNEAMLQDMQRQFNYSDQILRYQTVKAEELDAEALYFQELKKTQEAAAAEKRKPAFRKPERRDDSTPETTENNSEKTIAPNAEEFVKDNADVELSPEEKDFAEAASEAAAEADAEESVTAETTTA